MEHLELRQDIIKACLWLLDKGLVTGTWGNVSVRLNENQILLTPSRIDYDVMVPQDLVVVDYDGNKLSGERLPTSEMHLHRLIYRRRADVGAIVHYHPRYASAMCAAGESIPPFFEEMSQLIGGGIPITSRYVSSGQHLELAVEAAECIGEQNAVLIRNHAPVCCGKDLKEALVCCQVVEKAAACYIALKDRFSLEVIPEEYVRSERRRYLFKYGYE